MFDGSYTIENSDKELFKAIADEKRRQEEQQGNYTVIKKGLKAGQLVVSTGDLKLQNGTRVVINNSVTLRDVTNPDDLGQ